MDAMKKSAVGEIALRDRRLLELSGVKEAVRFDEDSAVLSTECGRLTVEGSALHVTVLDLAQGKVSLEGRVDALYYEDPDGEAAERRGLLARLFRG